MILIQLGVIVLGIVAMMTIAFALGYSVGRNSSGHPSRDKIKEVEE